MKRVLIVDNDAKALEAVQEMLASEGYEARPCRDPGQALNLVLRETWSLVVLELKLPSPDPEHVPDFDGVKFLGWLARLGRRIPVIVFTHDDDRRTAKAALAAGASHVVRKSDPSSCFLEAVAGALA